MSAGKRLLTVAVILAIAVGVVARLAHLDRKLFFQDEAYSALRITGHTEAQYRRLFDGRVRPLADVMALQRLDATSSAAATLSSIATEEPQRGPLYYALAANWVRIAGTSIAGFRSLSAVIGLLGIAAAYWLGLRLFESTRGGAVLAALVAVSPFSVLYAQQAREYGLLGVAVLAAGAALLGALAGRRGGWPVYGILCALGLGTSPLFALVLPSHAAYAAFVAFARRRGIRVLAGYGLATAAALAAMLPWFLWTSRSAASVTDQTEWGWAPYPPAFTLTKWVFNAGATFFDYEFADVRFAAVLAVVLVVAASLVVAGLRDRNACVFAGALALPSLLVVVGKDVVAHSHFSTIPRYVVPVWIALQIACAAGVVAGLRASGPAVRRRTAFAFIALLGCGAASVAADSGQVLWWSNNDNVPTPAVARVLDAAAPAVLTTSNVAITLSLAHYLRYGVSLRLHPRDAAIGFPSPAEALYLFLPSDAERRAAERAGYALTAADAGPTTIVHSFHAALARDRPNADSQSFAELSAQNALWRGSARPGGRAPKS